MSSGLGAISRKDFLRAAAGLMGAALAPAGCGPGPVGGPSGPPGAAEKFAGRVLADTAVAMLSFGAYIGDRLGLYKAMAEAGPVTASELAGRTRLNERYLREWLALMATAGYVDYDARQARYRLPPEKATVLCDENSPLFMAGFVEQLACVFVTNKVLEGFRGGRGPLSGDYPLENWEAIERNTAPSYRNFLTQVYLPAMPDIAARLRAGGAALDLGCGAGIASLAIAKAYPKAEIFGFDVFAPSIESARTNAAAAGLGDRVRFETYDGSTLPEGRFDLITLFYTLHHLTDPVKVLVSARKALREGGALLVMEANVPESLEGSVGNTYANWNYGVSLFYCMSNVLAEGGPAYGAAIKESQVKGLGEKAGFGSFRRLAVDSPYDALYEFKPTGP